MQFQKQYTATLLLLHGKYSFGFTLVLWVFLNTKYIINNLKTQHALTSGLRGQYLCIFLPAEYNMLARIIPC